MGRDKKEYDKKTISVFDLKGGYICAVLEALADEELLQLPLQCLEPQSAVCFCTPAFEHDLIDPSGTAGRLRHAVARLDRLQRLLVGHVIVGASPSGDNLYENHSKGPDVCLCRVLIGGKDLWYNIREGIEEGD